MNNQRFTEKDYQNWCEDYLNGMSSQRISAKYKPNVPSVSLVKEEEVLHQFQKYYKRGPEGFTGKTEFFSEELPVNNFIDYIDQRLTEKVQNED